MDIKFPGLSAVGLMALLWMKSVAGSVGDDITPEDRAFLNMRFANVVVAAEHAPLYKEARAGAPLVWQSPWMQRLPVDRLRVPYAPAGWIPIEGTGGKAAAKNTKAMPDAWIRRGDVVLPSEFKKVTGCWPVKFVAYVGGDYAAEVTFKTDGSAWVKEWGDEDWINKEPRHKAQVYMARNIVAIETVKKGGPVFFTSGYRPAERKIYPYGAPADEQELFPAEVMKGCPEEPLLAR